ncbi:MAG: DUF4156 domain-containing protein [Gammaproteobacteria bacterium]
MNKLLTGMVSTGVLLVLAGCTWVSPNPQVKAKGIMVLPQDRVSHCRLLSRTQVTVANHVGFINRSQSDVEKDLQNLAMNQAVAQGGDTVSAISVEDNGNQSFGIYQCLGAQSQPAGSAPATPPVTAGTQVQTTPYRAPGSVTNSPPSASHH